MNKKTGYLFLVLILLVCWSALSAIHENDFDIFLDAGIKVRHHINIYLPPYKYDLPYLYSPFFALLLAPFSLLPFSLVEFFWMLFMFYNLFDLWRISKDYFNTNLLSPRQTNSWLIITVFYILTSLLYNISQVQMTVFLCWIVFKCLSLIENKKNFSAATLLALIINIKIMPIVFLPYLLYRKHFTAFGFTILMSIFFLFVPIVFLGYEYHHLLLNSWWNAINPSASKNLIEVENLYQSVTSAIPVLFTDNTLYMGLKRNFINLSVGKAQLIMNLFRCFLILLTLFFLYTKPFLAAKSKLNIYWELSYIFLITPLIFPHQNKYAYFLLLPSFIYIIYFILVKYKTLSKLFLSFVIIISIPFTFVIGRDIIGNYLFDFIQFYRVLVFASILLIPILWYCKPEKINA